MEIMAALKGTETLTRSCTVEIVTDSQYLRDGATPGIKGWKARGWRTAGKDPVRNVDLRQRIDAIDATHVFTWTRARGHNGHPMNERADSLARAGMAPIIAADVKARVELSGENLRRAGAAITPLSHPNTRILR
jgi:ribonuclease HI